MIFFKKELKLLCKPAGERVNTVHCGVAISDSSLNIHAESEMTK